MIEHKITLTKRQEQMLKHIANGGTCKDFAEKYKVALKTAEAHRYDMMRQIDCHNMAQVTRYAIKFGFIDLGETP
jgi:DNA-binding NarL/FixJ family response regulator